MRKAIVSVFLVSVFSLYLGTAQYAHSDESQTGAYGQPGSELQPGTAEPGTATGAESMMPVSTAEAQEEPGALERQGFGIAPQVGMVNYKDTFGNTGNRATYGMTTDSNFAKMASDTPGLFLGPQVGFFYSHIGSGNANFFGSSPESGAIGNPGTNMFFIPTDLKLGYNLGNFRPSIRGGGNLYYRSAANSFAVGANPSTDPGSAWNYALNTGLDLEYAISKSIALIGRPDITWGGSNRIWNASLGANIPLG